MPPITIYTDGACINNPGSGGYGAILEEGGRLREISAGFRYTTNNRMELMAAIEGLRLLPSPRKVKVYSDSQYLVSAMNAGWALKWRTKNWMKGKTRKVPNHDLWKALLEECERHQVEFLWIPGHRGHPFNERCDRLALQAALRKDLPPDIEFERKEEELHPPTLF